MLSILACAATLTAQVGTVYEVNGAGSLQSVYNSPTFRGGEIYWNLAPGTSTSYLQDMFLNTASVPQPIIAFPSNCTGPAAVWAASHLLEVGICQYLLWSTMHGVIGNHHPLFNKPYRLRTQDAIPSLGRR